MALLFVLKHNSQSEMISRVVQPQKLCENFINGVRNGGCSDDIGRSDCEKCNCVLPFNYPASIINRKSVSLASRNFQTSSDQFAKTICQGPIP